MSITTDRPRTLATSPGHRSVARRSAQQVRGQRVPEQQVAERRCTPTGGAKPSAADSAQPSAKSIAAGVLLTAAILLGLVSVANLRSAPPATPAPVTSGVVYDVGVAGAPANANR